MSIKGSNSKRLEIITTSIVLDLAKAKKIAIRRRVWYKALNRLERGILDLTVSLLDNIRSKRLVNVVTTILDKLTLAMEGTVGRLVRIGKPLARIISEIALNWGNFSASKWVDDPDFALFLSINFRKE